MSQSQPPFQITGATVSLGGDPVLRDVSLTAEAGDFVAILGSNGAGKSTLLRALLGLVTLDSGKVEIWGKSPRHFRDWPNVAYVPQQLTSTGAVPVSVREVVASGQFTPGWRRSKPDKDQIRQSLEAVDLYHRRYESLDTLSGGQQRRVMIARALARQSKAVLLDEPFAGVDAANREHLRKTLVDMKSDGKTVLMVTHDLSEIRNLTTRCVVLGSDAKQSVRFEGPPPLPDSLRDPEGHHSPNTDPPSTWEMRI